MDLIINWTVFFVSFNSGMIVSSQLSGYNLKAGSYLILFGWIISFVFLMIGSLADKKYKATAENSDYSQEELDLYQKEVNSYIKIAIGDFILLFLLFKFPILTYIFP